MKQAPPTLLKGQAGVWRVASMLALRGYNPHFPGVDHGYDIMIEHGVRIQVKCTSLRYDPKAYAGAGCYQFCIRKCSVARGNNRITKNHARVFSNDCEFVILWGVNEDRFWIVPALELDGVSLVVTGPNHTKYAAREDITREVVQRFRDSGWGFNAIAEHLGANRSLVWKRYYRKDKPMVKSRSARVRNCENRWDLIDSYFETFSPQSLGSSIQMAEDTETVTVNN